MCPVKSPGECIARRAGNLRPRSRSHNGDSSAGIIIAGAAILRALLALSSNSACICILNCLLLQPPSLICCDDAAPGEVGGAAAGVLDSTDFDVPGQAFGVGSGCEDSIKINATASLFPCFLPEGWVGFGLAIVSHLGEGCLGW